MTPITRKHLSWKHGLSRLPLLGLMLCATAAFAAAPTVVVDSQLTDLAGLKGPESIVLAPNNMVYAANTGNNQIIAYPAHNAAGAAISTAPYTLVSPNALAVDSSGDLFIGDSPTPGTGRVLEAMATNGVLNGTVTQVVLGSPLQDVTALAVNSATSTLYIGDDLSNAVYTVALPGNTAVKLALTGVPSGIIPAALAVDAEGDLYIADFLTTLYEVPSGSLAAETYVASGFTFNSPTGLVFDAKGDLYILTLGVPFGTTGGNPAEEIVEIPGGDPTSAFLVPLNDVGNASALAADSESNLYVTDYNSGDIVALYYGSPVELYEENVGSVGTAVAFNYEFNAAVTLRGFKFVSAGDTSTEVVDQGGTCSIGTYTDGNNGGAITPSNPATCQESFATQPAYPGLRNSAVELTSTDGTILNTTQVYAIGTAGASVVYPLTASTGATLNAPEGLAVSGLNQKLYIVDAGTSPPQIYSANGPGGQNLTPVNMGGLLLGIPYGLAIDGGGNLYVADFAYGLIDVIPTVSGQTPYHEDPGGLLQHPISEAFDNFGDLYVGDAGPQGSGADAANPGYIVEVPADGGTPFKVNTGGITIIYPLSLATDPYTGDLYIGDGGDPSETGAQVVKIAAASGAATVVTPAGVTQPVGIVFDPAEQYYVLDQNSDTITVVPPAGAPYSLPFANTLFTNPVSLAITNGGQSLVESNVTNSTSNNLVYLNGLASPMAFGSVTVGQQSNTLTATVNNIGNLPLMLQTPYYTSNSTPSPFNILGSSTCADGVSLNPTVTCAINAQFQPTSTGSSTENLTLSTNGYNNGDSIIDVSGTGLTAPTVTVTCSPSSLVIGETTACTAQVSGGATGTVVFSVLGNTWETLTLNRAGSATATDGFMNAAVGTYTVLVSYSGDRNNSAATGSTTVVVTTPGLTTPTVTVTCSPNPLPTGETTACTAQVSGGATGTVVFSVLGSTWETLTLNGAGSATATGGFLNAAVGTYTVLVNYSGDSTHSAATGSTTVVVDVPGHTTPTVTVTCSPNPLPTGETTACTAQVSGGATGTVVFSVLGSTWETLTLNGAGSATATDGFMNAAAGTYAVLVSYSGNSTLSPTTGSTTVVVSP